MSDFKVIETQEQLDAIIGERLKRERETIRKEYDGFLSPEDATKKYAGYLSPEDEKKKYSGYLPPEEVAKKDAQIKQYETDSVKTRIAHEAGLSYEAIGFLKGDDEEAIKKSAESLKALVGSNTTAPLASQEESIGKAEDAAIRNVLKGLKGE